MSKQSRIKLVELKCPNCGAGVEVNENLEKAMCPYCGTTFLIDSYANKYDIDIVNNNISTKIIKKKKVTNIGLVNINAEKNVIDVDDQIRLMEAKRRMEDPEYDAMKRSEEKKFIIGCIIVVVISFGLLLILGVLQSIGLI